MKIPTSNRLSAWAQNSRPYRLSARALAVALGLFAGGSLRAGVGADVSLNGVWQVGLERHYGTTAVVPGLAQDPKEMSPGTLWYRREVELPSGDWNRATLTLNGARFAPAVYVDGDKVAEAQGGMGPIELPLRARSVVPGQKVVLEVALKSLRDLDPQDASSVPAADRWRSDVSSGLWDRVSLHVARDATITRIVPRADFPADTVAVHWQTDAAAPSGANRTLEAQVVDQGGHVLARSQAEPAAGASGVVTVPLRGACRSWTPDTPELYRVKLVLRQDGHVDDEREITWGRRDFRTEGLGFRLNGEPIRLRAGTVVWHRWLRDPQARTLAFDAGWFEQNILRRLKRLGANTVRFHLGLPPEQFLDLCDRDGVMVQLEWPFFHGIKASIPSMEAQWRTWLDVAMRHPSVMLIHAWNETEGDELKAAWQAMNAILPEYPPLVVAHRDVIHIHKYWWSLFENLGLYYDSAAQFGQPIMADEFGGNYLDYDGAPGAYPTVRESFLRFLGREQTRERRLQFQAEANARVAEYWRRIGAAGFSPFCMLSSPEDGNTWFLGQLKDGTPKPVWRALAAAYAEKSVSVDVWNRNYTPGERVVVPVQFFNDSGEPAELTAEIRVVRDGGTGTGAAGSGDPALQQSGKEAGYGDPALQQGRIDVGRGRRTPPLGQRDEGVASPERHPRVRVTVSMPAHSSVRREVALQMPAQVGAWRLEAELITPSGQVGADATRPAGAPVVSRWQVRTLAPQLPAVLRGAVIGIAPDESELRALARQNGIRVCDVNDPAATVIVGSVATWQRIVAGSSPSGAMTGQLANAVARGTPVVLLGIGPRDLGQGYKQGDLGPLDGAPRVTNPRVDTQPLFAGIRLTFTEAAEPESHLHAGPEDASLWQGLPREATWLWNGLRGGLVVPAADMDVSGLSADAFVALWRGRGADETILRSGKPYYAYALAGFYAFSPRADDKTTVAKLRAKVKFLAEDAPALQDRINPNAPVPSIDLAAAYRGSAAGQASALVALASAGKNLDRLPVVELTVGAKHAKVILSQVLTAGRLERGRAATGPYPLRYDPAAEQWVLNVLARAVEGAK